MIGKRTAQYLERLTNTYKVAIAVGAVRIVVLRCARGMKARSDVEKSLGAAKEKKHLLDWWCSRKKGIQSSLEIIIVEPSPSRRTRIIRIESHPVFTVMIVGEDHEG